MLIKSMSYPGGVRMLESEEAARRLGVKVATLYAYVSRGLLASHRAPDGRRSLFALDEVERLARRSRGGRAVESRLAVVTTGVTQLTEEAGPLYRGRPAVELATRASFEEVAVLLWDGADAPSSTDGRAWTPADLGTVPTLRPSDRMRWAVVMAGSRDPVRADLRPESVVRATRGLIATVIDALAGAELPGRGGGDRPARGDLPPLVLDDGRELVDSIAARLASRLSAEVDVALVRAVNASLVLLADHELASSTMAVRIAASTRADPYDAVLAGIGTIAGPLHGAASQQVSALLADAGQLGVERAVDDWLRWQGRLPGFGHTVYTGGDPRFSVLDRLFEELAEPRARDTVRALVELAAAERLPAPNVDLGLAAVTWAAGMQPDAGQVLFTVARLAGWIAHYLEELAERPLRYRARAIYADAGRV